MRAIDIAEVRESEQGTARAGTESRLGASALVCVVVAAWAGIAYVIYADIAGFG